MYGEISGAQCEKASSALQGSIRPNTDRQRLLEKKQILEAHLKLVDNAISMLDAHPELEEFTKVLQAGLQY